MAPEQILGKGVTGAADVFSLGAVLVFAATGEPPFPGDSSAALLYKVVHEEPELGSLAGELREVAAACLAKDPAARPAPQDVARRLAPRGGPPGRGRLAARTAGGAGQPGCRAAAQPGGVRRAGGARVRTGRLQQPVAERDRRDGGAVTGEGRGAGVAAGDGPGPGRKRDR